MSRKRGLLLGLFAAPAFLAVATMMQAGAAQTASTEPALPDGPGKEPFQKICSGCHLTSVATAQSHTAADWANTVDDMRGKGANGSDEDFDAIVKYLAKNFGPVATRVNINTADASSIAASLSIAKADAAVIVAFRDKNGKFKDLAALKAVPGVDAAKIDAAKDLIDF